MMCTYARSVFNGTHIRTPLRRDRGPNEMGQTLVHVTLVRKKLRSVAILPEARRAWGTS